MESISKYFSTCVENKNKNRNRKKIEAKKSNNNWNSRTEFLPRQDPTDSIFNESLKHLGEIAGFLFHHENKKQIDNQLDLIS